MIPGLRSFPSERAKAFFMFFMKSNIIKNVLFSVVLHGLALACCFAVPAAKLIPLFQNGNSALTLTSLSISRPADDQSKEAAPQEQETEDEEAAVIENNEEDSQDDLVNIRDEKPAPVAAPKTQPRQTPVSTQKSQPRQTPLDADAHLKGIIGGRAGNTAIRPFYPLGSRLRGEEGVVKVEVRVDAGGHPLNCAVVKSSGFLALDDAALDAVKHACFVTAQGRAPAKDSRTVLTFRFDLLD